MLQVIGKMLARILSQPIKGFMPLSTSDPAAFAKALQPGDVLLVEGIHGLNPELIDGAATPEQVFRVFVHPSLDLPFDAAESLATSDVRLLRRIVRDRRLRGYRAAETIAANTSSKTRHPGHPWVGRAATTIDANANGRAKSVWLTLTNEPHLAKRRNMGRP